MSDGMKRDFLIRRTPPDLSDVEIRSALSAAEQQLGFTDPAFDILGGIDESEESWWCALAKIAASMSGAHLLAESEDRLLTEEEQAQLSMMALVQRDILIRLARIRDLRATL